MENELCNTLYIKTERFLQTMRTRYTIFHRPLNILKIANVDDKLHNDKIYAYKQIYINNRLNKLYDV